VKKERSLLLFVLLFLLTACSKYCRYGEDFNHTFMLDNFVFGGSFSTIEYYLATPPDVLLGLNKGYDFPCEVKEEISFLEYMTGIQAHKAYEITTVKISAADSAYLVQDLEKWKNWYENNKSYLSLSKDYRMLRYKKDEIQRSVDVMTPKCRDWF
jgi:hypothetical protein